MMTSLGDVNRTKPMMQRRATNRFKPWKSVAFAVMLTVVLVTFTPIMAADKEPDSASADRSTRDVASEEVNPDKRMCTRDVAVGPSDPGHYKIEYTGHNSNVPYPDYFPDLDYGFLGYDILRGFPLNVGHDPGFTLPIFTGDYSANLKTADGLWLLPKGVAAVPDVSCITSFSSEVVKSSREFSGSMKFSANANGGGWGVSFSASVGFQHASSLVSSGEYVLIISKANCAYYFMKLLKNDAPPFHPAFIKWVTKLSKSNDANDFIDFFQEYGTHFVNQATFGASLTYEHKMSSSTYETMSSSGIDVAVAASYSGAYSLGVDRGLSLEQKEAAADFNSKVMTKTITIGSPPPANGDALTWASTVKQNPLPVSYDLTSIEELFSETFMGPGSGMDTLGIDYSKIKTMITTSKSLYCKRLQSQGLVNDCNDYMSGLSLENTRLTGTFILYPGVKSYSDCIDLCYALAKCDAVDFCDECSSSDSDYHQCRVYIASGVTSGTYDDKWASTIVLPNLKEAVVLLGTNINGVQRALSSDSPVPDAVSCSVQCAADEFCVAFTFCDCPDMKHKCKLYSGTLYSLTSSSDSTLYFVSPGLTIQHFKPDESVWNGIPCKSDDNCGRIGAVCGLEGVCICPPEKLYSVSQGACVSDCGGMGVDSGMMGSYSAPLDSGSLLTHQNFLSNAVSASAEECATLCASKPECRSAYFGHVSSWTDPESCVLFTSAKLFFPVGMSFFEYYQKVCQ